MITTKSSILCVLVFVGVATADVNVVFNKTEKINGQLESINIHNSLISAVICGEPVGPKSHRHCLITHTPTNNQSKSLSCPYELDHSLEAINAYPLTANKAILIVQTSDKAKDPVIFVEVISFTDCKRNTTGMSFEYYADVEANFKENGKAMMINDDGTFDILYNNAKLCYGEVCKLTFNAQGYIVKAPMASFAPLDGAYRMVKKIPGTPSFIVTEIKINKTCKISLIKPDGQIVLKEFKNYVNLEDHDVSTSGGLIRLCSKFHAMKVRCELFDYLSGNSTAKNRVEGLSFEKVAVENLSNGDYLLLGGIEETRIVAKIDVSKGSFGGNVELSDFPCATTPESYFDVSDDEYCITRQCISKGDAKIIKECFVDSEF